MEKKTGLIILFSVLIIGVLYYYYVYSVKRPLLLFKGQGNEDITTKIKAPILDSTIMDQNDIIEKENSLWYNQICSVDIGNASQPYIGTYCR